MLRGAASHVRPNSLLYTLRASSSSSTASSSTSSAPRPHPLTQPQKNLFQALEPLSKPLRRNPNERQRRRGAANVTVRKPQELLSYAQWFVDESRRAAQPADAKGKAKEDVGSASSSLFEHSPSSWALLLRVAANVGDGRAFVSILDGFARWRNELRQEQGEEDVAAAIQEVESLAAHLAFRLRTRNNLGEDLAKHPALQLPFMTQGTDRLDAARYYDGLSPAEIEAIFLRPLPTPRSSLTSTSDTAVDGFFSSHRPSSTMSQDALQGRANRRRPRHPLVTWISTARANSRVKKQVSDLMAVFRQAYDNRCTDETALRNHLHSLQAERRPDDRAPGPSALSLDSLGSLDDPESTLSILVKREALANAVILSWLRDQGAAEAGPLPWLLAVALRTFAQRGDPQRIRDVIAALKRQQHATQHEGTSSGDADQQPPPSLASDLFEAAPTRQGRPKRPRRLPLPHRALLNLLLRSHQVRVVNADSGRLAFKAAWTDLRALCGDPKSSRDAKEAQDEDGSKWAPDEESIHILLDLLRYDARRVSKGLRLVRLADASWGHNSPHVRRMLDAADAARRKDFNVDRTATVSSHRRAKQRRRLQREHRKTLRLSVKTASTLLQWIAQASGRGVRRRGAVHQHGEETKEVPATEAVTSASRSRGILRHTQLVLRLTRNWLKAERAERAALGLAVATSLPTARRSAASTRRTTTPATIREGLRSPGGEWARFRRAVALVARKEGKADAMVLEVGEDDGELSADSSSPGERSVW